MGEEIKYCNLCEKETTGSHWTHSEILDQERNHFDPPIYAIFLFSHRENGEGSRPYMCYDCLVTAIRSIAIAMVPEFKELRRSKPKDKEEINGKRT